MTKPKNPRRRREKQRRAREADREDSHSVGLQKDISSPVLDLCKWMKHNGFRNESKLQICRSDTFGYGLFTTKKRINANECVLSLPSKLLVTPPILRKYKPKIYGHFEDDLICLIVFLMNEPWDDANTPWAEYFGMLPQNMGLMPCTWPKFEVTRLLTTIPESYREALLSEEARMTATYYKMLSVIVANKHDLYWTKTDLLDFEHFERAYVLVNTRCIHLPSSSNSTTSNCVALAPYFDLFNHDANADVYLEFCPKSNDLQLYTRKPVKRFSQVFIKYNNYSNRQLHLNYGYCAVDENLLKEIMFHPRPDSAALFKPSEQDIVPISYGHLLQWLTEKETEGVARISLNNFMKRIETLLQIEFISPDDYFDLTWPNDAYFEGDYIVISDDCEVLSMPEGNGDCVDSTGWGSHGITGLDWRFDTMIKLMVRPGWDSAVNIRRLVFSDSDSAILAPDDKASWRRYYQMWIWFLEWTLARDYQGIHCGPGLSSLYRYLSSIVYTCVRTIVANEVAMLLALREEFKELLIKMDSPVMNGQSGVAVASDTTTATTTTVDDGHANIDTVQKKLAAVHL